MRYITVALAKGRLAEKAMEYFARIGCPCEEMKDKKTRKLIFTNEEMGVRFFLAKASDVPTTAGILFTGSQPRLTATPHPINTSTMVPTASARYFFIIFRFF